MKKLNRLTTIIGSLLVQAALWSCSTIDDDLDNCPPEGNDYKMEYQLRLVTNMTTELTTQLTTTTETKVASALQEHLKDIFSDYAHDVDLSFYDTHGDLSRLQHDQHIMNANQSSYALSLPMRQYLHLAVANVLYNTEVSLVSDFYSNTAALQQRAGTTIASHTTGLFTARQPMEVLSDIDQTFNVHLYMANSAAALIIDPRGHTYRQLEVRATGFATQFNISDSTYVFADSDPYIIAQEVETDNDLLCYCTVNFPSRDAGQSSSRRPTPPTRADDETARWQFEVYLTKDDGSVTKTVLDVMKPLQAGQLMVVKGYLDGDGAVRSSSQEVGVSVTLDWNGGGEFEEEL